MRYREHSFNVGQLQLVTDVDTLWTFPETLDSALALSVFVEVVSGQTVPPPYQRSSLLYWHLVTGFTATCPYGVSPPGEERETWWPGGPGWRTLESPGSAYLRLHGPFASHLGIGFQAWSHEPLKRVPAVWADVRVTIGLHLADDR